MKTSNECDILVVFDNKTYKITIDKNGSVSKMTEELFNSFSLDNKLYEISFKEKKLNIHQNLSLSKSIGKIDKNNLPCFYIEKKNQLLASIGKSLTNNNSKDNIYDSKNLNIRYNKQIRNNLKCNTIKLTKNNTERNNLRRIHKSNTSKINDPINLRKNINPLSINSDSETFIGFKNKIQNIKNNQKLMNDFYSQQYYIRNSSPYISEEEQRILNEKENKKHFLNQKDFILSVGHYSIKPNYIENYVQMTPSENPLNHKFREEKKEKWITKKGFINA